MSATARVMAPEGACAACTRRSWLLGELSVPLEHQARDRWRLVDLLALGDAELIEALGGSRRAQLRAAHETFATDTAGSRASTPSICVHDRRYPTALDGPAAPRMLNVAGGSERLWRLSSAPTVAILGSRAASDYGAAMARSLARGLALAGVCVASVARAGIGAAAQEGVLEAGGAGIAICGHGLDVASPVGLRPLRRRIATAGCVVSELAPGVRGRRWGTIAAERIAIELSCLAVLVEARDSPGDLFAAHLARRGAGRVAAMPGRLTSPLSAGAHQLLLEGASLIRDARDVLDLLYGLGAGCAVERVEERVAESLEARLRAVFDRVGAGADTAEELARGGDVKRTLAALGELELMGVLIRGEGGRYMPRDPQPAAHGRRPGEGSG